MKNALGIAPERSLPKLTKKTFSKWYKTNRINNEDEKKRTVYLFIDEFTDYNDPEIAKISYKLLTSLGYHVVIPKHVESGRAQISKGMLRDAQAIAKKNIKFLKDIITEENPLIGIEPSAILTFREEYIDLLRGEKKEAAKIISKNVFTVEEFLSKESENGKIHKVLFTKEEKKIKLHGHCQEKAIASTKDSINILSLPVNYFVEEIPSGCCGMAGSFGYEKEHYEISMKIGEQILFPSVREAKNDYIICAAGTSCRHQIKDGTSVRAFHPVEILYDALLVKNE